MLAIKLFTSVFCLLLLLFSLTDCGDFVVTSLENAYLGSKLRFLWSKCFAQPGLLRVNLCPTKKKIKNKRKQIVSWTGRISSWICWGTLFWSVSVWIMLNKFWGECLFFNHIFMHLSFVFHSFFCQDQLILPKTNLRPIFIVTSGNYICYCITGFNKYEQSSCTSLAQWY